MGMFNWVEYECDCPKCGHTVEGFQTKDEASHRNGLVLADVKPGDVDNFYADCEECGTWVEFHRIKVPDFPFRMTTRP